MLVRLRLDAVHADADPEVGTVRSSKRRRSAVRCSLMSGKFLESRTDRNNTLLPGNMKRLGTPTMRRCMRNPPSLRPLDSFARRSFALSARLAQGATTSPAVVAAPPPPPPPSAYTEPTAPKSKPTASSRAADAHNSAKLSALHARLSLPARFPVSTLARCLVHPSADERPNHNNASLAIIGEDMIAYYTAEWLMCNYPRLPMPVLFAAQYAYDGPRTLNQMRQEWGVESVAAPGGEVDPGLLQFTRVQAGNQIADNGLVRQKDFEGIQDRKSGTGRANDQFNYRRGVSSRIVYDNQFGDLQSNIATDDGPIPPTSPVTQEEASASFISAVFGALYLHAGAQATQNFHTSHILSRHLPLHTLFSFTHPTRDLSRLCAREGFEQPVARLLSETGRHSRSPVFVVGVYSGQDKLAEAEGSSLDEARVRAAAQALRSWYLYSPPRDHVVLPSHSTTKTWRPQMVDVGEIVT